MTLKDYIESLQEIVKDNPKAAEMTVIYSHDDEGNEYQEVVNKPCVCRVEPYDGYRFIEVHEFGKKNSNRVCIN